ncbi:hypothetical protein [Streptomyces sp. YIM 121038]|uniref:hypothetical protein n=1 Tax=Streptomyces sp. YIM 121038 TaxID=2136401 RepID=UPI00111013E3|nr:hypothetical protein [Streptomyces sp. YIM 121038]
MSRYSEQQRAEIEEAVQGLVGEMEDIVHHQVADGMWHPSYKEMGEVTDDELKEAAEAFAGRLVNAANKVLVATAAAPQHFVGEDR